MKFVSIRDFRLKAAAVRKELEKDKEIVLTVNGRPFAVLTHVNPGELEEELLAVRRARTQRSVEKIRAAAKRGGLDKLSMDDIDRIVSKARGAKKRLRRK